MPSIPQSLLWISLVVLWLFVLVPMLISKRDAVRRTSDVALATRVLTGSSSSRLARRGPAAGHRSDPDWQTADDHFEDDEEDEPPRRAMAVAATVAEDAEADYLDVDIVEEDSGALPVGASSVEETEIVEDDEAELDDTAEDDTAEDDIAEDDAAEDDIDEVEAEDRSDEGENGEDQGGEYEYVDDSSGLEAPSETDLDVADSMMAARRRRYDSTTAAAVGVRKFRFRQRAVAVLATVMLVSALIAFFATSTAWWVCGVFGAASVLYLAYLRRQTRIEADLRRRRAQRLARSRLGVENTRDREFDVTPARLRRPGAAVLDIDDEDPIFEHLDYASAARSYNLLRAAGQ